MKRMQILILGMLFMSTSLFSVLSKVHKEQVCPTDKASALRLYKQSYAQLLSTMGRGESGKLDTLKKREADRQYRFYKQCLIQNGSVSDDLSLFSKTMLKKYNSFFDTKTKVLIADMDIVEKEPYDSLKRVEISIRDKKGKEFFRAMNNRMDHPAPVPPNAFGIYRIGNKKLLTDKDILSAGQEAAIANKTNYGSLLQGCKTSWSSGVVHIHWKIQPKNWNLPDGKAYIYVKIVPKNSTGSTWKYCSKVNLPSAPKGVAYSRKSTLVTPIFIYRDTGKKAKEGIFTQVTLVRLKQIRSKGSVRRWSGDDGSKYSYKELSREKINLEKLANHTLALSPGFYRLEYNDIVGDPSVGFYGRSDVFE